MRRGRVVTHHPDAHPALQGLPEEAKAIFPGKDRGTGKEGVHLLGGAGGQFLCHRDHLDRAPVRFYIVHG
jgi:hypothetical protein